MKGQAGCSEGLSYIRKTPYPDAMCTLRPEFWRPEDPEVCLLLADSLVVAHFAVLLYVLAGQAVILTGHLRCWTFIRNPWFRGSHLLLIVAVTLIAAAGKLCPLTLWENELRVAAGQPIEQASFVAYWCHELLYIDLPLETLRWCYMGFGMLVLLSLWIVPVKWTSSCTATSDCESGI